MTFRARRSQEQFIVPELIRECEKELLLLKEKEGDDADPKLVVKKCMDAFRGGRDELTIKNMMLEAFPDLKHLFPQ